MLGNGCTLCLLLKCTAREPGSWVRQDKGKEGVLRFYVEFPPLCLIDKFFLGHLKCQTSVVREGWKGRAFCRALGSPVSRQMVCVMAGPNQRGCTKLLMGSIH